MKVNNSGGHFSRSSSAKSSRKPHQVALPKSSYSSPLPNSAPRSPSHLYRATQKSPINLPPEHHHQQQQPPPLPLPPSPQSSTNPYYNYGRSSENSPIILEKKSPTVTYPRSPSKLQANKSPTVKLNSPST